MKIVKEQIRWLSLSTKTSTWPWQTFFNRGYWTTHILVSFSINFGKCLEVGSYGGYRCSCEISFSCRFYGKMFRFLRRIFPIATLENCGPSRKKMKKTHVDYFVVLNRNVTPPHAKRKSKNEYVAFLHLRKTSETLVWFPGLWIPVISPELFVLLLSNMVSFLQNSNLEPSDGWPHVSATPVLRSRRKLPLR